MKIFAFAVFALAVTTYGQIPAKHMPPPDKPEWQCPTPAYELLKICGLYKTKDPSLPCPSGDPGTVVCFPPEPTEATSVASPMPLIINSTIPTQKTITCGVYQHNQHTPAHCANTCLPDSFACTTSCMYIQAEDKCVDDLHWVTEAEWQSLMKRLADLEYKGAVFTGTGTAAPTMWPTLGSAQLILDPVQAKDPGNEKIKQCGPNNHDGACFDPSMPHVMERIYIQKNHCEAHEGVKCFQMVEGWVPIGKPVFYDDEAKP